MMAEVLNNWKFKAEELVEEEISEIREALNESTNLRESIESIYEDIMKIEYSDAYEYLNVYISKKSNEYGVIFYFVTVKRADYNDEILNCGCDDCDEDCPLYGKDIRELNRIVRQEIFDWEHQPEKTIRTINFRMEAFNTIHEEYGRIYKGRQLEIVTSNFEKLKASLVLLDEFLKI